MKSMRQQLLQWLLLAIAVSSTLAGLLVYRHTRSEMEELYNAQLQQLAIVLAQQLSAENSAVKMLSPETPVTEDSSIKSLAAELPKTETNVAKNSADNEISTAAQPASIIKAKWQEESYLIQVWNREGKLLTTASPIARHPIIPLQPEPGFYRIDIRGKKWRVCRADSAHHSVQIAQPETARLDIISETSLRVLLPLTLQIPLLMLLAWIAVRRGLRPLDKLSNAIAQRDPLTLTPIDATLLPADLKPLVYTLNELLAKLDTALQQQRNFVADAAHELRTPIAALQLQLDLLQRADTAEDRQLTLSALRKGVQRATALIQQLLQIARSESAQATEIIGNISLQQIATESIERHLATARARNIDLGVTRLEAIEIRCAPTDIEIIVDNLLSNAIRYTPLGGKVDLAIYRNDQQVIIDVIDTGIGIPEPERARIFDRFHRVLTLHTDVTAIEGSGLGLAIVKTLCDRYGAVIEVDAGPDGVGSLFRISWPLATPIVLNSALIRL